MAELGATNVHGDLRATGDVVIDEALSVGNGVSVDGEITERGNRLFSPNNRNISDSVTGTSSTKYASEQAVKTAYDKGNQALNVANTKLGSSSKAVDSEKLNGLPHTSYLRSDKSQTISAGGDTTLTISASDAGIAQVKAMGSAQGTGVFYAGQSDTHGGGFSYNGDNSPEWVGEADYITFFRRNAGNNFAVFSFKYDSNAVEFRATPRVVGNDIWHAGNDGSGSGLDADKLDGQHASYFAKAADVKTPVPAGAVFTDTQRPLSSSVTSTSTSTAATSNAAKTAYDRGTEALNKANTKLDSGATAVNSHKLAGLTPAHFVRTDAESVMSKALKIDTIGDALVIGGTTKQDQSDVSMYIGNNLGDGGYGYRFIYRGTGGGNSNALELTSTNLGSGNSIFKALQDGTINLSQLGAKVAGNVIWHAGNDGAGSGLDADKLDGLQSSQFARLDIENAFSQPVSIGGEVNTSSSAKLQVNGFMRTGSIFIHEGLDAGGNNAGVELENRAGALFWGGQKLWSQSNHGNNSGLNADMVDGFHLADMLPLSSSRDFHNGTLVETSIDYSQDNGAAWLLHVEGNAYSSKDNLPIDLKVQGYNYNKAIIQRGGISYGSDINGMVAFNYNGKLCFWWPTQNYWQGFNITVKDVRSAGIQRNLITSIKDLAKPANITKEVSFPMGSVIKRAFNTTNDGAGSGLDADKLDGIESSSFARTDISQTFTSPQVTYSSQTKVKFEGAVDIVTGSGLRFLRNAGSGNRDDSMSLDIGDSSATFRIDNQADAANGTYYFQNVSEEGSARNLFIFNHDIIRYMDHTVWHAGNDGTGSGLDADLLDGQHASYFAKAADVKTPVPAGAVFTDTQRPLSSSVSSTSTTTAATSNAAKTAYDRGTEALNKANTKLDSGATAANSNKLGGLSANGFAKLGITNQPSNYLYIQRSSPANTAAFYVNQYGSGDIARFIKGDGESNTDVLVGMEVKGDGSVHSTGGFFSKSHSAVNPDNPDANVTLGWHLNKPRLRVGGAGDGANSAFSILSTADTNMLEVSVGEAYVGANKSKVWHAGNLSPALSDRDIKTPKYLGDSIDLNDLKGIEHTGFWFQNMNANTSLEHNYPALVAGNLTVMRDAGVTQVYRTYGEPKTFVRNYYNGNWSGWCRVYDQNYKPSASDVGLPSLSIDTSINNSLKITATGGTALIGMRNTSYCHYDTRSSAGHYFCQKIESAGSVICTELRTTTSSDKRLKENVKAVGVDYDKLDKLILLTGRYNQFAGDFAGQEFYGSIAQDVQAVFPHCVSVVKNDKFGETLAVDYPKLALAIALAELQRPLKSRLKRFFKSVWSAIKGK